MVHPTGGFAKVKAGIHKLTGEKVSPSSLTPSLSPSTLTFVPWFSFFFLSPGCREDHGQTTFRGEEGRKGGRWSGGVMIEGGLGD